MFEMWMIAMVTAMVVLGFSLKIEEKKYGR